MTKESSIKRLKVAYDLAVKSGNIDLIQRALMEWKKAENSLQKSELLEIIESAEKRLKKISIKTEPLRTLFMATNLLKEFDDSNQDKQNQVSLDI